MTRAKTHGDRRWELDQGATLYDVTHLACRSARYTTATGGGSCSPANAKQTAFPVVPGGAMPPVEGCTKQDYAVLIVIGVGIEDGTAVAHRHLAHWPQLMTHDPLFQDRPQTEARRSSRASRLSTLRRWAIQVRPPDTAHSCGVCGHWTQVLEA